MNSHTHTHPETIFAVGIAAYDEQTVGRHVRRDDQPDGLAARELGVGTPGAVKERSFQAVQRHVEIALGQLCDWYDFHVVQP